MPCIRDVLWRGSRTRDMLHAFITTGSRVAVKVLVTLLCSIWINTAERWTPRGSWSTLQPTDNADVLHEGNYREGSGIYSTCPVSLVLEVRLSRLDDKAEVRYSDARGWRASQKQADIGLTWGLGTYKTGMTHNIDHCVLIQRQ